MQSAIHVMELVMISFLVLVVMGAVCCFLRVNPVQPYAAFRASRDALSAVLRESLTVVSGFLKIFVALLVVRDASHTDSQCLRVSVNPASIAILIHLPHSVPIVVNVKEAMCGLLVMK